MNDMTCVNDIDTSKHNVMCFCVTLKCCQLIQQRLMAAECRVFGDNNAAEFHGISQTAPQNSAKFSAEKWALDITAGN